MHRSEDEWRSNLTPEQFHVLREKGTERPYSGKFVFTADAGLYTCAACLTPLFASDSKFESVTPGLSGWPGFTQPIPGAPVRFEKDSRFGMNRVEVSCGNCGSHLGHYFDEDPGSPDGIHYCINSVALNFEAETPEIE